MEIAVISDIHDNLWALDLVMNGVKGCERLFCLGDLCSPFTITAIAQSFAGTVHLVWGNNDGDRLAIARNADQAGNVVVHGEFAEFELVGRRVALTHLPQIGRALALGQDYDLVCYGHDHQRRLEWVGRTLLLNPGEVMGRFGIRSYSVYDTDQNDAHHVEV
jgi:uncharacterized protein